MPPNAAASEVVEGHPVHEKNSSLLRCLTSTAASCKAGGAACAPRTYCQDDFRIIKSIGHGDMGTVFLVALRGDDTGSPYAMKVMKKEVLAARENFHRFQTEKEVLKLVNNPFLPRLFAHFETDKHTFLVTDYCCGGDLNVLRQMQPDKRFSENAARFYAAEVLLALEYLHEHGIIYRDLKPENILIKENGHVMLTDFDLSLNLGTKSSSSSTSFGGSTRSDRKSKSSKQRGLRSRFSCGLSLELPKFISYRRRKKGCKQAMTKIFPRSCSSSSDCRSNSFVGTEEYVAPEVVWGSGHGMPVDWWTFGVFLYELVYAKTPFKGSRRKDTFYNILCKDAELPGPRTPLKDLIAELLVKNPEQRLGSKQGAAEIRNHAFFQGVKWNEVESIARPPIVPPPFSLDEVERARNYKEVGLDENHSQHHHHLLAKKKKKLQVVKQLEESVCDEIASSPAVAPALQDVEVCSSYDKYVAAAGEFSAAEERFAGAGSREDDLAAAATPPPPREVDEEVDDGEVVVLRTSTLQASSAAREAIGDRTLELLESKPAVGLVFEVSGDGDGSEVVVVVKNFESEEELDKVQQLVETESNFDVF